MTLQDSIIDAARRAGCTAEMTDWGGYCITAPSGAKRYGQGVLRLSQAIIDALCAPTPDTEEARMRDYVRSI